MWLERWLGRGSERRQKTEKASEIVGVQKKCRAWPGPAVPCLSSMASFVRGFGFALD
jgi:hypothetical protein